MARLFVLATILLHGPVSAAPTGPSVAFIPGDDRAWSIDGFMGHPEIETQNRPELGGRIKGEIEAWRKRLADPDAGR